MRFTVGGESFDLTPEQVIRAMKGVGSEAVQKHVVEIDGRMFPPKQVFAAVTGRTRQSFTTMEAQRVLTRLGFLCRRAEHPADDGSAGVATHREAGDASVERRLASVEASIGTVEAAIAGLHARVRALEAAN